MFTNICIHCICSAFLWYVSAGHMFTERKQGMVSRSLLQVCVQQTTREEQQHKQEGLIAFKKRIGFPDYYYIDVVFNDP